MSEDESHQVSESIEQSTDQSDTVASAALEPSTKKKTPAGKRDKSSKVKSGKKSRKANQSGGSKEKKKRTKKRVQHYGTYIYRVLKQVCFSFLSVLFLGPSGHWHHYEGDENHGVVCRRLLL